ncbi:cuticle collagen 2-like [Pipistrellus kuhlii]|uniref:cuticle collagen 2-like n=1 Tax=Pipistrellus kuhlii TaxID=59472 RepID=UPI001E2715FA|nr:cuticle collagen 2-like [Pipistrellus kuhlii]
MPTSHIRETCGSDTEWKARWRRRQWPGAKGRARSPRPSLRAALAAAAPRLSPPCPPAPSGPRRASGRPAPPRPAAAVREPALPAGFII